MNSVKNTTLIRSQLQTWYRASKKEYPWRTESSSAYSILVAEFMLQQTQAARVAQLLPAFLVTFPTIQALANAGTAQVVRAWRGLGYNSRAVRLRDTARQIVEAYNGIIPSSPDILRHFPGIGDYASNSLPCFIYNKRTVVVDVNVRRVYSRWMHKQTNTAHLESLPKVKEFANSIIPRSNASEWHHAVMDLGATICKARLADCQQCPIKNLCPSAGLPQAPYQSVKKREPSLRGRPRRLWRGHFIELLRNAGDRGLTLRELLPDEEATTNDCSEWMNILHSLQDEGLITVGKRVRLCD